MELNHDILTSKSDSIETKLNSIATALVIVEHLKKFKIKKIDLKFKIFKRVLFI